MSEIPEARGHVIPGMPVWLELGSPDPARAAAFYGALLGWEFEDMGEQYGHYTMIFRPDSAEGGGEGRAPVGAYMTTDPQLNPYADGASPGWTVYLATADLEAAARRATDAGGRVLFPPMAVGDMGASTVLADPAGVQVGLWQPATFPGTRVTGEPGTACWYEATVADIAVIAPFYEAVLGVRVEVNDAGAPEAQGGGDPAHPYGLLKTEDSGDDWSLAGLWQAPDALPDGSPGFWGAYLAVADMDEALATVRREGGAVEAGPESSFFGTVATIRDDQGARTRLMQLGPMPEGAGA